MTFDEWFEKGLDDDTLYTTDEQVAKWAWQAATIAERERVSKELDAIDTSCKCCGQKVNMIRGE